ncbi:MAG: AGE family epimerase/isomerase [Pedobacter sp.]|nr:AGE family epimerase/isomerase [Pedobacter sp.]MDQ8054554.1 AGE family epimerase/isomerase [Pedobacter sp.]
MDETTVATFKAEVREELDQLLYWWVNNTQDREFGGFYGKIDQENKVYHSAPKGLVLHARILYTFSSAYQTYKNLEHLVMAERAYDFLLHHFYDPVNGGFYWSVDEKGAALDRKKQVYGQAFVIYGLTAYYKAVGDDEALQLAIGTYQLLEKHSFDKDYFGYIEALSSDWGELADLRLSEKDLNEKKSMNTHLHVIEAYALLYTVWHNGGLKTAIHNLLNNFEQHIIDPATHHLHLFFTADWETRSSDLSFGHDIEAAWLLQEAAEVVRHDVQKFRINAVHMAEAAGRGIAPHGGLAYEFNLAQGHLVEEYHWWPQAEALVGFLNAYQQTGNQKFFDLVLNCWSFIKQYLKDHKHGEWFWGVQGKVLAPMPNEDKVGFWKCPYHNGRALLEVLKRVG